MRLRQLPVLALLVLTIPASAGAWGGDVHRLINRSAVSCLPEEFRGFGQWADDLERLSTDADSRKNRTPGEAERHYIDIDDYPEFLAGTLPHDYQEMILRYGEERVVDNGIAPWAIDETYGKLVGAFRSKDWTRAVALAADIGHYVGDLHNPLHITVNYNGQLTGNWGIHSRYESDMTGQYLGWISPPARPAPRVTGVLERVFDEIDATYPGVEIILAADRTAKAQAGGRTDTDAYYEALWVELGQLTDHWIGQATLTVASLWYSAWLDAGSPALPGSTPVQAMSFGRIKLLAR